MCFLLVNVETTGIIPPEQLFPTAIDILVEKIKAIQPSLDRITNNEEED